MAIYRVEDGFKGAITLKANGEVAIVYLADDVTYLVIHGDGTIETMKRSDSNYVNCYYHHGGSLPCPDQTDRNH